MTWNIDDLPKVVSSKRHMMLRLTDTPLYEEDIKNSPFFSSDELRAIEEKYKDGITRIEIIREVEKRLMVKWNTIKNYIQNDLVPRASRRVKTPNGMISVYPSNFIRHLNLVRYCLFSHKQSLKWFLDFLSDVTLDHHTVIADESHDLDNNNDGLDCFLKFWAGMNRIEDSVWMMQTAIPTTDIDAEWKIKYLSRVDIIEGLRMQLSSEMEAFEEELKKNKSSISTKELDSMLIKKNLTTSFS